ncbi:DUF6603 domain-containing protein [Streptomyces palmae]|uniref:DUF6603 domain-containing protein n=1 Tax=Streptomyces palmae TaxID=1701085 RepID=A0A4Z0HGP2_9ACTN|nr:hypothetical protein E4099_00125 [Streptomyces palmae]
MTSAGIRLSVTYTDTGSGVGVVDLFKALGVPTEKVQPLSALPRMKKVTLTHGKGGWLVYVGGTRGADAVLAGAGKWRLAQMRLALDARLSAVDLVKGVLPAGQDVGVSGLAARHANAKVEAKDLKAWHTWYGKGPGQDLVPRTDVAKGVGSEITVLVGTEVHRLVLDKSKRRQRSVADLYPRQGEITGLPAAVPIASDANSDDSGAEGGARLTVDRSVGPLHVRAATVELMASPLSVGLGVDASMRIAGVEVEAQGLGLVVPLTSGGTIAPTLRGLGLAVGVGAVEVHGALVRGTPPKDSGFTDQYDGALLVKLPTATGMLLGQMARGKNLWSLSAFGTLESAGGGIGPPPFRVTGAMLGGGYNSSVRVPEPSQVHQFPLVASLHDPKMRALKPAQMSKKLSGERWLTPAVGQNWVAVGLQFTSFEFLSGRALALVEFGNDLNVGVFALLKASFPTRAAAGAGVYAQIEVAMRALYQRVTGLLSFTAQLTENSYILHPSFALTGGLAVYVWSPPEPGRGLDRSGDFAITLGGYHPTYPVPDHYPRVPRLGARWSVSHAVSISATAYLAVTPGSLMLGAGARVTYQLGGVQAWFQAAFDGYLQWTNPPRYTFDVKVRVGVRAEVGVGPLHLSVNAEVGADCHVWGDPFGGTARVKAGPVSFTVPFGSPAADPHKPTPWAEVQRQLPPPVAVTPMAGLLTDPSTEAPEKKWRVAPDGLCFTTNATAPATELAVAGPSGETTLRRAREKTRIRPMKRTGLDSRHKLTVHHNQQVVDLAGAGWGCAPVTGAVPEALWGDPKTAGRELNLLTDQLTGLEVTAPTPSRGPSPGVITPHALSHKEVDLVPGKRDEKARTPLGDRTPTGTVLDIKSTAVQDVTKIKDTSVVTARGGLLQALADAGAGVMVHGEGDAKRPLDNPPLTAYGQLAATSFTDPPLTPRSS